MGILDKIFGRLRNKILLAFSILITAGVSAVVWVSTNLSLRDSLNSAYAAAAELSKSLLVQFEQEVTQALTRSRFWVIQSQDPNKIRLYIEGDETIAGVALLDANLRKIEFLVWNKGLYEPDTSKESTEVFSPEDLNGVFSWEGIENETSQIKYLERKVDDKKIHFVFQPLLVTNGRLEKILVTFLSPEKMSAAFEQAGVYEKFLFNSKGEVLLRSLDSGGMGVAIESKFPPDFLAPVAAMPKEFNNTQIRWASSGSEVTQGDSSFVGHVYRSNIPGLYVTVLSPTQSFLESVYSVARRSIYLGLAILSLALVFGILFSDSIVKPITALVEGTLQIARGDFSVRLKGQSRDEIFRLTNAFNSMAEGLAERERIKEVFGKFHSKAVFQKLLKEDRIRLGGERIPVTVFFSDIRSFTSTSETMTPEAVVEMLNEYMSEMVSVIEKHGGVVDKYVGDAIMAIWGMPEANPPRDAENAVRACLEMRDKLKELNYRRVNRGQMPIEIGMGLNSGEVVAGNIGSPSRMEYTVIGDTVNTASRMESLTKEYKTDFLLSESTLELLSNPTDFEFTEPFFAQAKGKAEKIRIYGCKGTKGGQVQTPDPGSDSKEVA